MTQSVIRNTETTPDGLCRKTTQWKEGGKGVTKCTSEEVIKCSPLPGKFQMYIYISACERYGLVYFTHGKMLTNYVIIKTRYGNYFFSEQPQDIQHQ